MQMKEAYYEMFDILDAYWDQVKKPQTSDAHGSDQRR
jgi:hypothetical protein